MKQYRCEEQKLGAANVGDVQTRNVWGKTRRIISLVRMCVCSDFSCVSENIQSTMSNRPESTSSTSILKLDMNDPYLSLMWLRRSDASPFVVSVHRSGDSDDDDAGDDEEPTDTRLIFFDGIALLLCDEDNT